MIIIMTCGIECHNNDECWHFLSVPRCLTRILSTWCNLSHLIFTKDPVFTFFIKDPVFISLFLQLEKLTVRWLSSRLNSVCQHFIFLLNLMKQHQDGEFKLRLIYVNGREHTLYLGRKIQKFGSLERQLSHKKTLWPHSMWKIVLIL